MTNRSNLHSGNRTRNSTSGNSRNQTNSFTRNSITKTSGITSNASYESLLSLAEKEPDNNIYIAFGIQDLKMKNGTVSTVRVPNN